MATSIQVPYLATASFSTKHQPFHKTQKNPPPKPIKLANKTSFNEAFQTIHHFPTEANYASILEFCATRKALSQGQQIHAHLLKSGALNRHELFLCTKLVFMYGKCGSVSSADRVFDEMTQITVFTWNALIGGYVTNYEFSLGLELYGKMRVSGEDVDACTFPCVLKACGVLKNMRCGEEVHGLAIKMGYEDNDFVVNSLVYMYAKCEELVAARKLFDGIVEREDVVTWNLMISAYSANGQSIDALHIFSEMQRNNIATNTYTFVAALGACEESSLSKKGMEIHAAILKCSQAFDVYVANALISMYTRCGRMSEALNIFNEMKEKDNISWNSLLSGLVQNRLYYEALSIFRDMLDNTHQKPDQVSVIGILTSCGRLSYLLNGMEVHAYAIKNGLDTDLHVGNTLVDMYSKCCLGKYMDCVFHRMPNKDFISWKTLFAGYAQNNCHSRALELFRKVMREGMGVDSLMIGSILMACNGLKATLSVKEIHGYITRRRIFDLVLQNTVMDVYGECGNIDYAARMFEMIESKDVVSWTSIISSYTHNGLINEAFELFQRMNEANIEPDTVSIVSILSAAASLAVLKKGKEIHGSIIRKGFILEGSIASSLVDMYARCGTFHDSFKVFNLIKNKDLVLWTSMIHAYGMHGQGRAAIDLFEKMKEKNPHPDHDTFLALLYACSHSGLIDKGKNILEIMKCEYALEPWPEHYACLVDLLGRANHIEEAYRFVKSMQAEPTAEVWCALLSACRNHSNKEIGDIAAQKLLKLDPANPGNYVLISNVFASSKKWKDVEKLRMRMKENKIKKNPGYSWIEVGNKVHKFMAMDTVHPESDKIHQKVGQITEKLVREGSYVAQTKFVFHDVDEEEKVKMLYGHSERLAIAYGLLNTCEGTPVRVTKNLRFCGDCHVFCKLVSKLFGRELVVRDANRFHHFENGVCSCGDFW